MAERDAEFEFAGALSHDFESAGRSLAGLANGQTTTQTG
jgi:hypothetical protein